MNKKQLKWLEENYLYIFLIIIIALITIIYLNINHKSQFTITKETCWNETTEYYIKTYPNNCSQLFEIRGGFGMPLSDDCNICFDTSEFSYSCIESIETKYSYITEQKCETKEVDEIKLKCFNSVGNLINCVDVPDGLTMYISESWRGIKKSDELGNREIFYEEFISISNLTENWLNENCDCIEEICPSYYHYSKVYSPMYDGDCYINNAFYDITMIDHKPKICKSWNCGDYEVTKNE